MAQIEMDNVQRQLIQAENQRKELQKIDTSKPNLKAGFGTLVLTDKGIYLIGVGIGVVTLEKQDFYCISLSSPIGQILNGKPIGDTITFRNNSFIIKEII